MNNGPATDRIRTLLLVLPLFFLSGALGLVYQVVWTRVTMHVFGSTALAVGTVLAAFMSGLALGAWLIGRYADRAPDCLRLYALLELGIAVTAMAAHLLLVRMAPAHLALYELAGSSDTLFALLRFGLAFALILAPTLLMGATLPVLTRYLARRRAPLGVELSTLYAVNTLGAVAGVLLAGFFLIRLWGIHGPVYLAVAGNALIGVAAWVIARASPSEPPAEFNPEATPKEHLLSSDRSWTRRLVFLGLGLSGFTSFAYEIYWTRALVFILGNSTYALTTMLAAFLSGIALGGYLARFLVVRFRDHAAVFAWLQVLIGLLSALALPMLFAFADPQSLNLSLLQRAADPAPFLFAGFGLAFLLMLLPATLIGATFPLAGQIWLRDRQSAGADTGRLYAFNTLGNVLGALAPGLFLLAWLGIQRGIVLMAVLNVTLGLTLLLLRYFRPGVPMVRRAAVPLALAAAALALSQSPIGFQFPSEGEQDHFQTLYYREGPLATTKVYVDPLGGEKFMSVDGIVIGGTGYTEFKQLLLAHLPKLLTGDASTELSVGIGSGILLGESLRHPQVESLTGVEIEPSVIAGAGWFAEENHGVLDNPRLRVVDDDIDSFLRTSKDRYRVISADEKTADEYASNGFSYSKEYYDLLREHLEPGGLAAQWVPTTLPPSQYQMVLRTFLQSFPHTQLWYFLPAHKRGPFNTLLIGSLNPIEIDPKKMQERLREHPGAFASLAPYGLTSAEAVLPHFVADERLLGPALENAEINRFDHPRYEFYFPWDYAHRRDLQILENHRLLRKLKREAHAGYLAGLVTKVDDPVRLRQTFAAEFRYLEAFEKFLSGIPLNEHYRLFDDALAVAPWNDSLRARIYAQYAYLASTQRDPVTRQRLLRRAEDLYPAP